MPHPVYEALLRAYCETHLIHHDGLAACIELGQMPPQHIVDALEADLGVPRSAWTAISDVSLAKPASVRKTRQVTDTAERRAVRKQTRIKSNHQFREPASPATAAIYAWMDSAGYTSVQALAEAVSSKIGRALSRPSVRDYLNGYRSADGKRVPAIAPSDVRKAVEELSRGKIPADAWPCVR